MTEYVIIGFGFSKVFSAPDKSTAVFMANGIAFKQHLYSWLLYDSCAELIFEK